MTDTFPLSTGATPEPVDLEFHPFTEIFPLMEGEDFEKFKRDISLNGQCEPIVLYQDKILDGRNRYRACMDLGLEPDTKPYTGSDPLGFVISMNIHRRHLTAEQRREIIAELLKANPQLSDRAIAAQANVSHHTVAGVREATGQTAQSKTRTGLDGKKRKTSPRKKGVISPGKRMKQVEAFKETWDSFDGWQQRAFVKTYKDQLKELLQEVENEDSASVEMPNLELA